MAEVDAEVRHFLSLLQSLSDLGVVPKACGWNSQDGNMARVLFLSNLMGREVRGADELDEDEWRAVNASLTETMRLVSPVLRDLYEI